MWVGDGGDGIVVEGERRREGKRERGREYVGGGSTLVEGVLFCSSTPYWSVLLVLSLLLSALLLYFLLGVLLSVILPVILLLYFLFYSSSCFLFLTSLPYLCPSHSYTPSCSSLSFVLLTIYFLSGWLFLFALCRLLLCLYGLVLCCWGIPSLHTLLSIPFSLSLLLCTTSLTPLCFLLLFYTLAPLLPFSLYKWVAILMPIMISGSFCSTPGLGACSLFCSLLVLSSLVPPLLFSIMLCVGLGFY